jgi:hypothetical protein
MLHLGKRSGEADRRGGLPYPALLVGEGDDPGIAATTVTCSRVVGASGIELGHRASESGFLHPSS